MSDPLHTNEQTPDLVQNRNGDYDYEVERGRVRAMPPINPTHFSNDFLNRTANTNPNSPPNTNIQGVFQDVAIEENNPSNRRTIEHSLREQQRAMREKMNQAISARAGEYEKMEQLSNLRQRHPSFRKLPPKTEGITLAPLQDNDNQTEDNAPKAVNDDMKPRKDIALVEGFTTPGKVLGQQEDLLYSNKTVNTRVLKHDHNREFKRNYRRYYEAKREKEERLDRMKVAKGDPLSTNNLNYNLPPTQSSQNQSTISRPGGFGVMPKDTVGNQLTNPNEMDRYNKPRQTVVTIDSRDRDRSRYPNANQFKIQLGSQFRNVKRVVIQSTEFPNTALLVRDDPNEALLERNRILLECGEVLNDANNHLYWFNAEDAVQEGIYDCLFYTADITPGNYDADSLAEEIETQVSQINHFDDGTPHQFIVDINTQTNVVRFLSVESITLGVNPITSVNGTNVLTINQTAHPFSVGDTVTITGSSSVGGITADAINREHTIQSVPSVDSYTIQVSQIATSSTTGGGANVLSGENKPIKLLFSNIDTVGSILGFPQQDSSDQIAKDIEFIDTSPLDLTTLPLVPSPSGTIPARIRSSNHGLIPGDEILITDTNTIPNINGIQTVTKVITEDEFEIGTVIKVVNNQTETTNTIQGTLCKTPDSTTTEVTALTTSVAGNIITAINHNFDVGDLVFLANIIGGLTQSGNDINEVQTVSANIDAVTFDITNGILFEGTDFSGAFAFKTDSTESNPISGLIPQNNGVIEPVSGASIFTGSQIPTNVFFTNMGNTTPTLDSNIFEVCYYSTDTGRFCLTTPITSVDLQLTTQSFIRSRDSDLRNIVDAFPASNGTFRLNVNHNLVNGNTIYIRSLIPELTTSEPRISPDITGILTVNNVFDAQNFDTLTEITTALFDTGDIGFVQTDDNFPTAIQNIYPYSNNYLAKDLDSCNFPDCDLCENSLIYIFDSFLREATTSNAQAAILEEPSSNVLLDGIYMTNQVFGGQSKNFTHIFDLTQVVLDVVPVPIEFVSRDTFVSQEHTVTFFYDFCELMCLSPTTTGTVTFGGTKQLNLDVDTPYNFTFTTGSDPNNVINITNGGTTSTNPIKDVGPLLSGDFYVKSISFDQPVKNAYGNCVVLETGGGTDGTNGEPITGTFSESSSTILANTSPFLHGLASGEQVFIIDAEFDDPTFPFPVTFVDGLDSGLGEHILTLDAITHDIQITINNPSANQVEVDINGRLNLANPSELKCVQSATGNPSGSGVTNVGTFESNTTATITYPTNTFAINRVGIGSDTCGGGGGGSNRQAAFASIGSQNNSTIVNIMPPVGGNIIITATPKASDFLVNKIFGINVIDSTNFQIALPTTLAVSGFNGELTYHRTCGGITPIGTYFGNSWPGLFESQNNALPSNEPTDIYIGKSLEAGTTPAPIDPLAIPDAINGTLNDATSSLTNAHPFESPLNFNFFSSVDLFSRPIIVEEINATDAEFVKITGNTTEFFGNIQEITAANNGIIETANAHAFVGGESLYFLDDVNINNGVLNDLREGFFQIGQVDPVNPNRFSLTIPITRVGTGNIGEVGTGRFFYTYENESVNVIQNINANTNGTFISTTNHSFDTSTPTEIFITDNEVTLLNDVFTNAVAIRNPSPSVSATEFTTDVIFLASDIDPSGTVLDPDNIVDIINTNNDQLPQINGIRWVRSIGGQIPISDVNPTRSGTLSPVKTGLSAGDYVYIASIHPTTADLNGVHQVSYVDANTNAFFELSGITLTDIDGPVASGNIIYFCIDSPSDCVTINSITEGPCPSTVRATNHGFAVDSLFNVAIIGTDTLPDIDVANVNIIENVTVIDEDDIELVNFSSNGSNVCVQVVNNKTNTFIEQQGQFSKEILSTNCGRAIFTSDPMNGQTIVSTETRTNLKEREIFPIVTSTPISGGASRIVTTLPTGITQLPFKNGDIIEISGHINGDPHIDGTYKAFNILNNEFSITSLVTPFSTGGSGGFVTGPSADSVPGHGLFTGDKVLFTNVESEPDINNIPFTVTVISPTEFTIPVILNSVVNKKWGGVWCSNIINMEIPDHGLVDGDTFFLYNAQNVGGVLPEDLNTQHGDKRMNIPTKIEQETQKTVRVVDDDNIQFAINSTFPVARTIGGGFTVCISANNHLIGETESGTGRELKNYGFNAIQTNQDCLGSTNMFVNLNTDSYVLLISDILNHILNTGSVRNIFAKIQLDAEFGQVAYNSFVTIERVFDNPIVRLDEIDFEIRRHDGKLFDLRGRDWSISLLIEEYQDRLRNAEISSRRGIPDRGAVSAQGFIESTISAENPQQNVLSPTQFTEFTNLSQRVNVPNNSQ